MTIETRNTDRIHPEDPANMSYWTRKFGVSTSELNEAILYTGSLNSKILKQYIKRNSWLYHPIDGTTRLFKNTILFLF